MFNLNICHSYLYTETAFETETSPNKPYSLILEGGSANYHTNKLTSDTKSKKKLCHMSLPRSIQQEISGPRLTVCATKVYSTEPGYP